MRELQKVIKLIIFGGALALIMSGCQGSQNDLNPERHHRVIAIEGHEYIFISRRPFSAEMAITHKANCKAH